jgi:hypothetical protein
MLISNIITINTDNGLREIFISPFLLHSKMRPDIKSGKIEALYFYDLVPENEYNAMLEQENLDDRFKSNEYIINYGQDFEKYHIGSFRVDADKKLCWGWEGKPGNKMSDQDIKVLGDTLFNPGSHLRVVTLFTPTRASDFNLRRM